MSETPVPSIVPVAPRSAAGIAAFRDHDALRAALRDLLGVVPPLTPGFVQAGDLTLSCLAPARYFVAGPRDAGLPVRLAEALAGLAAVTDQSDVWVGFVLSGLDIRETLARVVPIDLTPDRFPVGGVALTRAGHLDVRLWRIAAQSYELAVSRSYADDLRHALGVRPCPAP
jgi:sarcosine oxidase subunit gamma